MDPSDRAASAPVSEAGLIARLHAAQNDFYAGGGDAALRAVLSPDVTWHVPGRNAIAGDYEGIEAVLDHFARRRDLAAGTFRTHPRDLLTGGGEWVAALTDGEAVIGGREVGWSTVGLYRLSGERVTACRLLPFEPEVFDAVWAGEARPAAAVSTPVVRVRPRHCDAQGMVYAGRYHEFFEDAFLDWLDEHAGGYERLRSGGVDMVVVASGCEHRRPARLGDRLSIETRPGRVGSTSLTMAFKVSGPEGEIAVGRITYVAVEAGGGSVPLPATLAAACRPEG
jgi:YbgC/YbaW family acyl-CoA thioester hydrolase